MAAAPQKRVRDEIRSLSGTEKAAVLMFAVGEENAKLMLEQMGDDEIRELSQTMVQLGGIDGNVVERLFVEFADNISATGSLIGSYESTERLLSRALSEDRVGDIMNEIMSPAGRTMWDKLANVNEVVLANYLKNEYPQTVAVVLSKVRPDHAARVLGVFPEGFSMDVIMRMLRMETVQHEVLEDVENTLKVEFMSNLARTTRRDSHELIAEIFNSLDRTTEARFLTALEDRSSESAEKIRALMFTFEDLGQLDPGSTQTLIARIDNTKLAMALKGASETLKDMFFSNMSSRAGKIMQEEMEGMGPVRMRDVDEAQTDMVNQAKQLAADGEILLVQSNDDDELIY